MSLSDVAVRILAVLLFFARPLSCGVAISLEVKPPGEHLGSVDAHGFGVLGAILSALFFAVPVLWLLLQRSDGPVRRRWGAGIATLVLVGSPMLLQLTYLAMPIEWCWPVIASGALWLALVAVLAFGGQRWPGAQPAFDRYPITAWSVLALVALFKVAVVVPALL
jgi:hypothetical protein